ncbi:hypothetical protein [Flocculibacter collagenilyticus]|uniref:hypothetical protein n=1 Tax=Flocculibacter collagenilyticus TaxID=2744479 RepID=UPI0018F326F0|nr:hypothetical protein [Flocculibacter collagenilyticus]
MVTSREILFKSALDKLEIEELSVLITPFAAVAFGFKGDPSLRSSGVYNELYRVMESYRRIIDNQGKPFKWLAADGTEYDTCRNYLFAQWGVGLPYPEGPFEV